MTSNKKLKIIIDGIAKIIGMLTKCSCRSKCCESECNKPSTPPVQKSPQVTQETLL